MRSWKISRLKGRPYDFYRSAEYVASAAGYDLDKVANSRPYSSGPLCRGAQQRRGKRKKATLTGVQPVKGPFKVYQTVPSPSSGQPAGWLAGWLVGWLAWLVVTLRQVDDGWKQPERNLFRSPCKHRFTSATEITSVACFFFSSSIATTGRSIEDAVNCRNFSPIDSSRSLKFASLVVWTDFTINGIVITLVVCSRSNECSARKF